MFHQVHHRFPATAEAPGAARVALVAALAYAYQGQVPVGAADAAVVVSELVTNAVRAGAAQVDVEFVVDEGDLLIRVSDDASGLPTPRAAGLLDTTGRGLQLVEALAHSWHTVPHGAAGKSVEASIDLGRGIGIAIGDGSPARRP